MTGGIEWLVDAHGCDPARLADVRAVRALLDRVVAELALCVVGEPQVHRFGGPGGVTALYLLTESHLACHTYPESGLVTINLHCCRARPAWPWSERLAEALGAAEVTVCALPRGRT